MHIERTQRFPGAFLWRFFEYALSRGMGIFILTRPDTDYAKRMLVRMLVPSMRALYTIFQNEMLLLNQIDIIF